MVDGVSKSLQRCAKGSTGAALKTKGRRGSAKDMPVQQMQPLFISTISSLAWMTSPSSIPTSPASRPGIRVHTALLAEDGIAVQGGSKHCAKVYLTEFVLDDGQLFSMLLCQDAVDQGGLAGPKKASDDGDGNLCGSHSVI